jgi:hypothetical protein
MLLLSLEATSPGKQAAYDYPKHSAYNCRNPRIKQYHFLVLRPLSTKEIMMAIGGAKESRSNVLDPQDPSG